MTFWADAAALLDSGFAPLFRIMAPLEPVWQGAILGAPVAALALVVYRLASNQSAITATKSHIKAQLLALRLFRDDLGVVLRTQGRLFSLIGRYLRLALVPLAILIIPVLLILIQLEARFAYRPLDLGEPALVKVRLAGSINPSAVTAKLDVPRGLRLETKPFRLNSERSLIWRLSAVEAGAHPIDVDINGMRIGATLWAGDDRPELLMPAVYRGGDFRVLVNPGGALSDPGNTVERIDTSYPTSDGLLFGLSNASWSMFLSSLIFGFLLRGPMKVDF